MIGTVAGIRARPATAGETPITSSRLDELNSLFRRFDQPPGGQYSGWYQYMDRDLRALRAKKRLPDELNIAYCGKGKLGACRASIWAAIQAAAEQLTAAQGTSNPNAWQANAIPERISFSPLSIGTTLRYTNRPSGIQQVIWFKKK
jgi:hypothetical protein